LRCTADSCPKFSRLLAELKAIEYEKLNYHLSHLFGPFSDYTSTYEDISLRFLKKICAPGPEITAFLEENVWDHYLSDTIGWN